MLNSSAFPAESMVVGVGSAEEATAAERVAEVMAVMVMAAEAAAQ